MASDDVRFCRVASAPGKEHPAFELHVRNASRKIMALAVSLAELKAAWRLVRADHRAKRTFVRSPVLLDIIETDLDEWLREIEGALSAGSFTASPQRLVNVPKPGALVRPGAVLESADEVVYSALVLRALPRIVAAIHGLQPVRDYSYPIAEDGGVHGVWFAPYFRKYKAFTSDSISAIDSGCQFVVVADIAGYYEQIDLPQLRSDLLAAGVSREELEPLMVALHRWGPLEKRGLPQGYSPSDVLGKLYLHHVDQALAGRGYRHIRWVDDYRIFVKSEAEGRAALQELAVQCGRRGLVLQSAKTQILEAAAARAEFAKTEELLKPVAQDLIRQLQTIGALPQVSVSAHLLDQLLTDGKGGPSVAILEEAFRKYFVSDTETFSKTLLRYLLKRLASAGSHLPLVSFDGLLRSHPEETACLLSYASEASCVREVEAIIVARFDGEAFDYPYQLLQMLEWRLAQDDRPTEAFLRHVRRLAAQSPDRDVVSFARATMGRWGEDSDLEDLCSAHASSEPAVRAEIICYLGRMELGKRNAFLGRAAGDGAMSARAVAGVKSGALGWRR